MQKFVHVNKADFIGKDGLFFEEIQEQGGELKIVPLENGREGQVCCSFVFPEAEAGFVLKIGGRKLVDWEKDYMNQLLFEDLPAFVIRFWRDNGRFSLSEYYVDEGAPFKNGELKVIIKCIRDYL